MHGDHRAQTGTGIGRKQDLLVAVEIGKTERVDVTSDKIGFGEES